MALATSGDGSSDGEPRRPGLHRRSRRECPPGAGAGGSRVDVSGAAHRLRAQPPGRGLRSAELSAQSHPILLLAARWDLQVACEVRELLEREA